MKPSDLVEVRQFDIAENNIRYLQNRNFHHTNSKTFQIPNFNQ